MNQKNSKRKQQTSNKKSDKVFPNSAMSSTQQNIEKTKTNIASTSHTNNSCADKTKDLKEIGKCNNQTEIEIAQRANRISEISVIVNIFMFIATIAVFIYSVKSTDAATKSANVADSTLKVTKEFFKIQNEPFLQIANFDIDTSNANYTKCKIEINNLGNYPVKINECFMACAIKTTGVKKEDILKNANNQSFAANRYITKEYPFKDDFLSYIPHKNFELLKMPNFYLFTIGYIKYENLVTKEPRTYLFQIIYNKNITDKIGYIDNENF